MFKMCVYFHTQIVTVLKYKSEKQVSKELNPTQYSLDVIITFSLIRHLSWSSMYW